MKKRRALIVPHGRGSLLRGGPVSCIQLGFGGSLLQTLVETVHGELALRREGKRVQRYWWVSLSEVSSRDLLSILIAIEHLGIGMTGLPGPLRGVRDAVSGFGY